MSSVDSYSFEKEVERRNYCFCEYRVTYGKVSFSSGKKLLKIRQVAWCPLFTPMVDCEASRLSTPDSGHDLLLCTAESAKSGPLC